MRAALASKGLAPALIRLPAGETVVSTPQPVWRPAADQLCQFSGGDCRDRDLGGQCGDYRGVMPIDDHRRVEKTGGHLETLIDRVVELGSKPAMIDPYRPYTLTGSGANATVVLPRVPRPPVTMTSHLLKFPVGTTTRIELSEHQPK